jgi:phosphoribosylformylglycinamidine synthase
MSGVQASAPPRRTTIEEPTMPRALVITAAGINCDAELVEAFELAGADVESIHLNRLAEDPSLIDGFQLVGLPGGFSYGDAVAAGRIASVLIRTSIAAALRRAVERGVPMIAPCNGFQIAVQVGLLPGGEPGGDQSDRPTVALARNTGGRFVDRWTRVEYPESRCVWTKGLEPAAAVNLLPSAHGEGRFVPRDAEQLAALEANGQVAVRYAADDDINGSVGRVAGICDPSGLVFGLMPHPERYTRWTQHPWWTRLQVADMDGETPGLQMFRAAVAAAPAASASADSSASSEAVAGV